jgi:hypothetical protein
MSSPKTIQPLAAQHDPRGMLVRPDLLSLKQIEKAPETPGFLFLRPKIANKPFLSNILAVTCLN